MKRSFTKNEIDRMLDHYRNFCPLSKIAEFSHCSVDTVRRVLREHGVTIRSAGIKEQSKDQPVHWNKRYDKRIEAVHRALWHGSTY